MELRRLRYFIAVAEEEGSLSNSRAAAAEYVAAVIKSANPGLRYEVGTQLLDRQARGVCLRLFEHVFLNHARLALLLQVEAAVRWGATGG